MKVTVIKLPNPVHPPEPTVMHGQAHMPGPMRKMSASMKMPKPEMSRPKGVK